MWRPSTILVSVLARRGALPRRRRLREERAQGNVPRVRVLLVADHGRAEVGRRKKERLRRSRARPKSASIRRDTYGHLVDGREPVPRGPQHVDPRARRQHRQTGDFNFRGAAPEAAARLKYEASEVGSVKRPRRRRPRARGAGRQSGKNLILERSETREEVIRRVQLERFRKDDRKAQLKWQALKAFLRACELHFLLDRTVIEAEAPLLMKVADLFDAKKTVSRSNFRASMSSLNITKDLSEALWEHFSDENGFNALGLLLALRLLADTYPGTSRREPLEAKLPGCSSFLREVEGASMTCRSSSASRVSRTTNAIP